MYRKIALVIICVMVITSIFSGCAKKESGEKPNKFQQTQDRQSDRSDDEKRTIYDNKEVDKKSDEAKGADIQTNQTEYVEILEENLYNMDTSIISNQIIVPDTPNTEEYTEYQERGFQNSRLEPLSTFSIDVDTASYSNMRRYINYYSVPDPDAIRIEEMLNYFSYDYKEPDGEQPFEINTELGLCPWNKDNYLLMIGLQGKEVNKSQLPKSNLVFLIDVSGSMYDEDKLPLLKNAFSQLVNELTENDRVSIVVYAGSSGVVLDSAHGNDKERIINALNSLEAGGSTAGAEGIQKAYALAEDNFIKDGNNRVILATDGDFNVGPYSLGELQTIIEKKRESGIYLSVLGFGTGNIKDSTMELLADKGNGNYAYIDTPKEAKKVLVDEMSGTLLTIAKDVKIQLEFNPELVAEYRLIGYENRALNNEDFVDDKIDAGELGAGHTVTAIYEIIPGKAKNSEQEVEDNTLKYKNANGEINDEYADELVEIRLRYKEPDESVSKELKKVVNVEENLNSKTLSKDYLFAAAVSEFGMILMESNYKGDSSIENILKLANDGIGTDEGGYRQEFISLVETYKYIISVDYQW